MLIDVQFHPVGVSWPLLLDATHAAERLGYDTVWVFDHLLAETFGGEGELLECCTLLGALAAATERIGLGPLVANTANRHPAVLARALASAQRISAGRVVAGLGAGAGPDSRWAAEHHRLGIELDADLTARHRRVVEQIDALRAVTELPIIVGAASERLARVAGEHADGLNVALDSDRATALIDAARRAAGDRAFEISVWTNDASPAAEDRAGALGADRLVLSGVRAEGFSRARGR